MKSIEFIPYSDYTIKGIIDPPKSANRFIPDWYKKLNDKIQSSEHTGGLSVSTNASNTTMKHCPPFLDALTTGYIWTAPSDILVYKENDNIFFRWRTEEVLITEHSKEQHETLPPAIHGSDFVLKWSFHFWIKTPPGYSTMFTHPFNRHDLPFRTFTGIVDTDRYMSPVQFPFQFLNVELPTIIEKGTPLCQIFPFKRDNWNSKKNVYSKEYIDKINFDFHSKIIKAYKSRFWSKKNYK